MLKAARQKLTSKPVNLPGARPLMKPMLICSFVVFAWRMGEKKKMRVSWQN